MSKPKKYTAQDILDVTTEFVEKEPFGHMQARWKGQDLILLSKEHYEQLQGLVIMRELEQYKSVGGLLN